MHADTGQEPNKASYVHFEKSIQKNDMLIIKKFRKTIKICSLPPSGSSQVKN